MLFNITRQSGIPLVGTLYFGIVDRGTNLLQIRPSCSCNLNCPFCSVDAGPLSRTRVTEYSVELDYLLEWVKAVIDTKGIDDIECHIDSPGEPLIYPQIIELVAELRKLPEVKTISMQTNGTLLDSEKIVQLQEAGLDRINLSMHALDPKLSKTLAGVNWYDIEKIKRTAKEVAASKIDLLIAPVYLPGINDEEIPKLIKFAKEIGAGKKWPKIGIQKFERYKLGRAPKGIKSQNWWRFYNRSIKGWENEFGEKLILSPKDFGIHRTQSLPIVMDKGEKLSAKIVGPGWLKDEMLGMAKERCISVMGCKQAEGNLRIKIVNNKHNVYIGVPV